MSLLLPTPPPVRRSRWTRLAASPEARSVQIGVAGTILAHVLLLLLAPRVQRWVDTRADSAPDASAERAFEIEFAPETFSLPVPPKPPVTFVEANPNAPDNVPDNTTQFAAQNQQAAQEIPTPKGKSEVPAVDGEREKNTTAIVSGQLAEPALASPPRTPEAVSTETEEQREARRLQDPLAGTEKLASDTPDGIGSNIAKLSPNTSAVPERVEGSTEATAADGAIAGVYYKVDPKKPRPRASLPSDVVKARPSPLRKQELGTENIGAVAYDAKWSSYGEYLKKFIDTVQVQWERIIGQTAIYPARGTQVTVVFCMDAQGDISRIVKVDGTGNKQASYACVSAITARAPYGAWTEEMTAVLGTSQEFTFTFTYQ